LEFEIVEPKNESEIQLGTVSRAKATCPCCNITLPPERVQAQLAAQRGGADVRFDDKGLRTGGAFLLAVVSLSDDTTGRQYRLANAADYEVVWMAHRQLIKVAKSPLAIGLNPVPDEPLPPIGTLGFRVQLYGMLEWGDLFTARQKLAALTLTEQIVTARHQPVRDPLQDLLGCALRRVTMSGMSCTRWNASAEKMQHTFGRQALPIVWDFTEVAPLVDAPGNWRSGYDLVADVIESFPAMNRGSLRLRTRAHTRWEPKAPTFGLQIPRITMRCRILTYQTFSLFG